MICQSECPWPGSLVHLSQHSGGFLQPCVDTGTKLNGLPALLFFTAGESDLSFVCLSSEQSVLTATRCNKDAYLDFDRVNF